jgi:hypothetical protein
LELVLELVLEQPEPFKNQNPNKIGFPVPFNKEFTTSSGPSLPEIGLELGLLFKPKIYCLKNQDQN